MHERNGFCLLVKKPGNAKYVGREVALEVDAHRDQEWAPLHWKEVGVVAIWRKKIMAICELVTVRKNGGKEPLKADEICVKRYSEKLGFGSIYH